MKLALITDSYLLADSISANFIQVLAEGLYHIGHDVLIVTPELDRHHAEMEGQVLLCAGKKNWNAAGLQLSGEGVKQMTEALDAFHPDLLHIHTLSETGAYLSAVAVGWVFTLAMYRHGLSTSIWTDCWQLLLSRSQRSL